MTRISQTYYLGYWIGESRKMAYKAQFRPADLLIDGQWQDASDALLKQLASTRVLPA